MNDILYYYGQVKGGGGGGSDHITIFRPFAGKCDDYRKLTRGADFLTRHSASATERDNIVAAAVVILFLYFGDTHTARRIKNDLCVLRKTFRCYCTAALRRALGWLMCVCLSSSI